jgi:hypothetical protein
MRIIVIQHVHSMSNEHVGHAMNVLASTCNTAKTENAVPSRCFSLANVMDHNELHFIRPRICKFTNCEG